MPEIASKSEDDGADEDCPFESAASLDDIDVDLAANTEQPMELDGELLTAAEVADVDLAVNEFARKVWTLVAEADAIFATDLESNVLTWSARGHHGLWMW